MALNYMGIVSYGSVPSYGTGDDERARLAVSMGLITFALSEPVIPDVKGVMLAVGRKGIRALKGLFRVGR